MKVYEILEFNRELLERLGRAGVRLDDARYVDLYADYERMVGDGCKVTYVMAYLSRKYGVCERKAYSLVKRLKSDCKDLCGGGGKTRPSRCNHHAAGHARRMPPVPPGNATFAAWTNCHRRGNYYLGRKTENSS